MDKKKKILVIISLVTVIAGIFCISSFAYENSDYYGMTISSGTVLRFKDTPDRPSQNLNFSFRAGTNPVRTYEKIYIQSNNLTYKYYNENNYNFAYNYDNNTWVSSGMYRNITLNSDITLEDNYLSNYLIDNVISGIPEPPPRPMDNVLDNVNSTFGFTLTAGSLIISWLIANQIALAGLYLYILIALIGVMKRFFVT